MSSIIIMAGGMGTRFWPASRKDNPKQFLNLTGDKTMIRETAERILQLVNTDRIFVVTTANLAGKVAEELDFLPPENIITEPEGRNTAPCVALAMAAVRAKFGPDEVTAILPADHKIGDVKQYLSVLKGVFEYINENNEVATFGIRPSRPETGYGYIETGSVLCNNGDVEIRTGIRFVEKPDEETARQYVDSGKFLWNSGMFVLKTGTFMQLCSKHLPEIYSEIEALEMSLDNSDALVEVYSRLPKVSFDNGIMEKLDKFVVAPGDFGWDDLGSWLALENNLPQDEKGNVLVGNSIRLDVENSIIYGNGKQTVAAVGLKNFIVVVRDDVIMICPKDRNQKIKQLVDEVKSIGREDLL